MFKLFDCLCSQKVRKDTKKFAYMQKNVTIRQILHFFCAFVRKYARVFCVYAKKDVSLHRIVMYQPK